MSYMSEHRKYPLSDLTTYVQCSYSCRHPRLSIATSCATFLRVRKTYSNWAKPSPAKCPSMMRHQWRTSFRCFSKTKKWCSTWWTITLRIDSLIERISSQFSTQSTLSTLLIWLPMQTNRGLEPKEKLSRIRPFRSTESGGTSSMRCPSSVVSIFQDITSSGTKGRTIHLLKESTKPVQRAKKRRKVALLEIPQASQS